MPKFTRISHAAKNVYVRLARFTRNSHAAIPHIMAEAKVNHAEAMVAALADKELAPHSVLRG